MPSKVQIELVLSLMDSKARPRVAEPFVEMCRGADHVPADPVDEADFFDGRGQIRLAKSDGSFHNGARSCVDVKRLQAIANYAATSWYKNFACLSEAEHFGDAVSAFKYGKYEFVREIQEGSVCFGLRFVAGATLALGVEDHSETIQEQSGGTASDLMCDALCAVMCVECCAATK